MRNEFKDRWATAIYDSVRLIWVRLIFGGELSIKQFKEQVKISLENGQVVL